MNEGGPDETKSRGMTSTAARGGRTLLGLGRWVPWFLMLVLLVSPLGTAFAAPSSTLSVSAQSPATGYELRVSSFADRHAAETLDVRGVLAGKVQVFVTPEQGVSAVRLFVDPPAEVLANPRAGASAMAVIDKAPFAYELDTAGLSNAAHTVAAEIRLEDGSSVVKVSRVIVYNGAPALLFGAERLQFSLQAGKSLDKALQVFTSDGKSALTTLASDAPWLTFVSSEPGGPAQMATAPGLRTVHVDASGLSGGSYTANITATAAGLAPASTQVTLVVAGGDVSAAATCSPVPCDKIKVTVPYVLDFNQDAGGVVDKNNVGTGFTYIQPTTKGTGYIPGNLRVNTAGSGTLDITTTAGIAYQAENTQDNALGVGIDASKQINVLEATLINLPASTGDYQQAGLWYGTDEDNYVKLVAVSEPDGWKVQLMLELAGTNAGSSTSGVINAGTGPVTLRLRANPTDHTVIGYYAVGSGTLAQIGTQTVPGEFFNADAAGIDPVIGTRVFGGVFTTDRFLQGTTVFSFDRFSLTSGGTPAQGGLIDFDRSFFPVTWPTSMVFGPDGRLYIANLFGKIVRVTLNSAHQAVQTETFTTLGAHMLLGITVDPSSTSGNVILWVSFSSPNLDAGEVNSGGVSKVWGANLENKVDVITGLPRSFANHATNAVHFGPDGKLYIAQAGNTGAGAPNNANTEFGDRPEQPLSAALLVADVNQPGFNGACATPLGSFGPVPCDVKPFATGFRNLYDFVIASNGLIYGPDNGLGVVGSYPPVPTVPCTGLADPTPYTQGGQNPGVQPDILLLIEQGKYYGHPNPYRNECVFKDGHYQGVAPLPNYQVPLFVIGPNTSSDGIIEYKSNMLGGVLKGNLLFTNYSVGDNIMRVKLSPDGRSVQEVTQLAGGFNNPLPIVEGPDGTLYVGELEPGRINVLVPKAVNQAGTWKTMKPLPKSILDPGSAVVNGKLYVVSGKGPGATGDVYSNAVYIYDPATDTWSSGTPLPAFYPAVENPSAVGLNGKLYLFGGSKAAFGDAVANAAVFDPLTNTWTELKAMPGARGGATAQALNGKIYIAGGMDTNGGSLNDLLIYDPATDNWSNGAPMAERRDNPGSAAVGGKLYVFGGRTRNADGSEVNGTLNSAQVYDPATGTWSDINSMPTGRRTMSVGTLNGRIQVIGGERTPPPINGTFSQNEEYDPATNTWRTLTPEPTPRHGSAYGTVGDTVYVVGGGPSGGSTYSMVNEAFTLLPDSVVPPPPAQNTKLFLPWVAKH